MYFEEILQENRPEVVCFMQHLNASFYDVTGKEARNWCKKCYVTCVLLENKFMKWLYKIYEMALWKGKSLKALNTLLTVAELYTCRSKYTAFSLQSNWHLIITQQKLKFKMLLFHSDIPELFEYEEGYNIKTNVIKPPNWSTLTPNEEKRMIKSKKTCSFYQYMVFLGKNYQFLWKLWFWLNNALLQSFVKCSKTYWGVIFYVRKYR